MPRPPSANSIIRNQKTQKFEPKNPIASEMFLPNKSGISTITNTKKLKIDPFDISVRSDALAIVKQTQGSNVIMGLGAIDGDGTDDIDFVIGGVLDFDVFDNVELMAFGWDSTNSQYTIKTVTAGTGTNRPINIYTHGNSGQLYLKTDGKVGMGTDSPDNQLHIYELTEESIIKIESDNDNATIIMDAGGAGVNGDTRIYLKNNEDLKWRIENDFDDGNTFKIYQAESATEIFKIDTAEVAIKGTTNLGDGGTTNYAEFKSDGEINLHGTAKVTRSKTFLFNYSRITGQGKPTLVNRGIFFGWSLPIYSADDEELYTCSCIPTDWDGVSDPVFCVAGWIDTANTDKKFKLQCSVNTYDPITNEVVPATTVDYTTETTTGTDAQYTSYIVCFTLDASAAGLTAGKSVGIRIRRVDATASEITGEFVVEGAIVNYTSDRLGAAT